MSVIFYKDLYGFVFTSSYEDGRDNSKMMEIQVSKTVFLTIKTLSERLIIIEERALSPAFKVQSYTLVSCVRDFLPENFLPGNISYYNISDETLQWIKENLGLYD